MSSWFQSLHVCSAPVSKLNQCGCRRSSLCTGFKMFFPSLKNTDITVCHIQNLDDVIAKLLLRPVPLSSTWNMVAD